MVTRCLQHCLRLGEVAMQVGDLDNEDDDDDDDDGDDDDDLDC